MVYKWLNNTQHWLPSSCLLCGADAGRHTLCDDCLRDLPRTAGACHLCALPLALADDQHGVCGHCQKKPPPVIRTLAPLYYAAPVDYLIQRLKYNNTLSLAALLGKLMAEHIGLQEGPLPERIIPVPLHPHRLWERGYNQSLELARPIADALGIPLDFASCRRIRHTDTQSALSAHTRRKNVRGVFAINENLDAGHVAIVDDVMTTGSTAWELASTLRKAGVISVEVWACARASMRD